VVDRTEPSLLMVQRAGVTPAVLELMVQVHWSLNGTDRVARPMVPTFFPAAFWTVSSKMTVAGPVIDPEAVVLLPETSHEVFVGWTPSTSNYDMKGIE